MADPPSPGGPRARGIPMLGLGTWQNRDHDQCAASVRTALDLGYRHVDTATAYGNEAAVGDGLAAAAVDADDVFVATKVWHADLAAADVVASAERSRSALGVGTIDLLYVHWPAGAYDAEATLGAMADLRDDGVIGHVGVSNFTPDLLREVVEGCDAPILANQVECHPFLQQEAVREASEEHDVQVVAYSPLARGAVLEDPTLAEVAEAHDASPAQVSLAWLRTKGVVAIPKATGRAHLAENLASLEVELTPEAVAAIDEIDRQRRVVDPPFAPW